MIQNGNYKYAQLGLNGSILDPVSAQMVGLSIQRGWFAEVVIPNTGAANSGLRRGNVIVGVNNYLIKLDHDLPYLLDQVFSVGDKVTLQVFRNGQIINIDVVLTSRIINNKVGI